MGERRSSRRVRYDFDVALKRLLDIVEVNLNEALGNYEVSKSFFKLGKMLFHKCVCSCKLNRQT
jgi:hypothetical protein